MPIRAIARLIQTMLYSRRFFPYYVYNILGGIEEDGEYTLTHPLVVGKIIMTIVGTGAVYSFDPVGSYEREACRAAGAAQSLVQPFLDNQVSCSLCDRRVLGPFIVAAKSPATGYPSRHPILHRPFPAPFPVFSPSSATGDTNGRSFLFRSTSRIKLPRLAHRSLDISRCPRFSPS